MHAEAQINGKIKKLAKENNADARVLMRMYMMEHFLERLAVSKYSDNFVIKGGILVTAILGVSLRTTMDIDTSIRNINLTEDDATQIVTEIISINLDDGVTFNIKNVTKIMDEMEYQGIRLSLEACMSGMTTAIKIDISTGDVITPRAIEYNYRPMLEEKSIKLWSYNLETVLAEKIQTILSRGVLNTRMRDYYDVYLLKILYDKNIDKDIIKKAFGETCNYRGTVNLIEDGINFLNLIENNQEMITLWKRYQQKYEYARDIKFENIMDVLKKIILEL